MAVSVDTKTGLKIFNTRAAKASEKITGTGYAIIEDEALKTLPPAPAGAIFNAEEQAKYREFKEARMGAADYMSMEGEFSKYLEDVYSEAPVARESLDDECEILVVGAGFAGLLLWHKLQKAGFKDVRFCEKGGDVGGTWYWNRYPGIACDVEAYSYLPLLEEMGYIPTMKFASGFEIMEYCQKVAEKFGFYDHCLFHTTVERTDWDAATGRWTVTTDRGDEMKARYVILANGILTTPKLARIKGMETFQGEAFHTSRWDYRVDLKGKRVGIIGTGATAVQTVPELSKIVNELFVFQRTPSSIDVRDQRATTPEEIETWKHEPGWAKARRARFAKISAGRTAMKANDDYLAGKVDSFKENKHHTKKLSIEEAVQKQLNSNFRIMEQIRNRVDAMVEDPATAEALKPFYPYGCKRPTFHDEYLTTFNKPHVTLVDTAPRGVSEINERGVVHDGKEYPLDVLIYATGFRWMATSTFNMIRGVNGRSLKDKWENDGTSTFLGLHSNGFPNLFIVSGPQGGGGSFNFTNAIEEHADYIAWMLTTMRENSYDVVDVKPAPEAAYTEHCKIADINTAPLRDCVSYYNGDGEAEPGSLAYYGGGRWHKFRVQAQETLDPYEFSKLE
ncbi:NAD(P)/FAD-dependent oxidoreductase [Pseudomonadales bacterium]|nr:NAD(P)/FAD-dependent oxidoreductase [Pseudomonadales bacterium]MDB2543012.1 NAD(P)/FAD-dependent oxidoreductase [Pseudomonadales bacterium]MDC0996536.1 NAD(P)/FAD-dependent oxidoreductase [Pseudomonadales bacterium]MDG1001767.1 NAD(P)/FAD-dependent oxidoreductase [Pseudomonadales bacterium]MDG1303523.1 NAD(P)/FAD-dependent oxidoreductase [Pseudomonadales bacterium]|tara:strand:+ start:1243 stop:3099 length:1857 start_codon:yes stop_codon:yes gene_type:complete